MSIFSSPFRPGAPGRARPLALLVIGLVFVAGCTSGGGTVKVTLQEWAVVPDKTEIGAGSVVFEVTNSGPDDIHEFVVIKTDLAPNALPTDADGAVDEAGGGMVVIGEIEDVAVGVTQSVTLDLTAGKYVLLCNIWSEDEQESHYQEGMRIAFTVN
ncbi:MAG TPA: hypothetical protein VI733_05140 [Candidatus Limnocylindria bacterium]|nr:hypothetical protein [Candidatus Limnocylindria bacterium]